MSQKYPLAIAAVLRNDDVSLSGYFALLMASRWLIGGFAGIVLVSGVAHVSIARPVYQADILAQGEDSVPNVKPKSALGDVSKWFDVRIKTTVETKIPQSRVVFEAAVDEMGLNTSAKPTCLTFIRNWLACYGRVVSELTFLNVSGYGWGNERFNISNFYVLGAFVGERFTETSLDCGRDGFDPGETAEGRVGSTVVLKQFDSANKLRVDSTDATPGTKFVLINASLGKLVECPQNRLNISQKGCKDIGIISTSLLGSKRQLAVGTLTEIGNAYVNDDLDRKAEEAEKSLAFLNEPLTQLRQNGERSEGRYHDMRNRLAVFSVSKHRKPYLSQCVAVKCSLLEVKHKRAKAHATYALGRLAIQVLDQRIGTLSTIGTIGQGQALPPLEKNVVRLIGDVSIDNELYMTSFEKTSMAEVVAAATHLKQENAGVNGVIFKGLDADVYRYCPSARTGLYRNAS